MLVRALDVETAQRRAFAARACEGDRGLLERVLRLLDAADESCAFLDEPALDALRAPPEPAIPDAVGNYLIIGVLGSGGMATVYEAVQDKPKRRVALKVMRQSMTQRESYLRFRLETEVLARLSHPGIAQIYESGAAQLKHGPPAPFFAMELVHGALSLTTYADNNALAVRERVAMLASVCDAVHHGHQHGVIHRDLKPGNVLVDGEGRAKVIDFGVARAVEDDDSPTRASDSRHLIGTLNYMSPEQCDASGDIDIRTDVYSLGVLLYELLCGRLPHDLSALPLPAALNTILAERPRPPDLPAIPRRRDLEAIILKAIDKQPDRRYDGASALASDLRRWLESQPISARPAGIADQCALFARRNPGLVAGGAALAASIILVAAISTMFAMRLSEEVDRRRGAEQQAVRERDVARWQAYTAQMAGAFAAMNTGEFEQMRTRLDAALHPRRGWEWGFLAGLAEQADMVVEAHEDMIMSFAVDDGWSHIATGANDGTIRLWDADDGSLLASVVTDSGARVSALAFTHDRRLACGDGTGVITIRDARSLAGAEVLGSLPAGISELCALPDGRIAAAAADGSAALWSLGPRAEGPLPVGQPGDQPGGITGIALSPDSLLAATWNARGLLHLRDARSLTAKQRLEFPGAINKAVFSNDGGMIAAVGESGRLLVWSTRDGALLRDFEISSGVNTARTVAFSPDGQLVAAGLVHRGIAVFSIPQNQQVGQLGGHTEAVSAISFHPDGGSLLTASWDRTFRKWRVEGIRSPGGVTTLQGHHDRLQAVAFSPDGSMVASAGRDGAIRLWDPDLGSPVARIPVGGVRLHALDFARNGDALAVACDDGIVRLWDPSTGRPVGELIGHEGWIASVSFDPTGSLVATGGNDATARIWDRRSPANEPLVLRGHEARVNAVGFSPDGLLLATASRDRSVRLWDARTGRPVFVLEGHDSDVFAVLFDHEGRRLYTGARDQTIRVWDVQTGEQIATLDGHGQFVTALALSPDGTRLAASSWFGKILLFDIDTYQLIASFRAHDAAIRGLDFSPDGRWLASASYDGTIRLFDAAERADRTRLRERALTEQADARARLAPMIDALDRTALERLAAAPGLESLPDARARKLLLSILHPVGDER